jgi:hypothetical protein
MEISLDFGSPILHLLCTCLHTCRPVCHLSYFCSASVRSERYATKTQRCAEQIVFLYQPYKTHDDTLMQAPAFHNANSGSCEVPCLQGSLRVHGVELQDIRLDCSYNSDICHWLALTLCLKQAQTSVGTKFESCGLIALRVRSTTL